MRLAEGGELSPSHACRAASNRSAGQPAAARARRRLAYLGAQADAGRVLEAAGAALDIAHKSPVIHGCCVVHCGTERRAAQAGACGAAGACSASLSPQLRLPACASKSLPHSRSSLPPCLIPLPSFRFPRLTADGGQRRGKGGEEQGYESEQSQLHHDPIEGARQAVPPPTLQKMSRGVHKLEGRRGWAVWSEGGASSAASSAAVAGSSALPARQVEPTTHQLEGHTQRQEDEEHQSYHVCGRLEQAVDQPGVAAAAGLLDVGCNSGGATMHA